MKNDFENDNDEVVVYPVAPYVKRKLELQSKDYDSRNKDGGIKNDAMKPRMSLIPQLALKEVGKVMTYGAEKYAEYNWMNGFDWTVLADAAQRHIGDFLCGEDLDDESKLHHLAHAACCCLMALENCMLYPEKDDRWEGWEEEKGKQALKEAKSPYKPSEYLKDVLKSKNPKT